MDSNTKEALIEYVLIHYGWLVPLSERMPLSSAFLDDCRKAQLSGELYERIMREHRDEVFMNYCPVCGMLARTPRALQCPNGHRWSGRGTPGTSG